MKRLNSIKNICFSDKELTDLKKFVADEATIKAKAHMEPSPETKKTFSMINEELTNIKLAVANVNGDIRVVQEIVEGHISREDKDREEIKKVVEKIEKTVDDFINNGHTRFASKWVESLLIWTAAAAGIVVIGGVGKLIWEVVRLVK